MAQPGSGNEDGFAAGARARALMRGAAAATPATQAGGQPFASLVTPAVAPDGSVLLFLSTLSEHTRHLLAEPRCALLFTGPAPEAVVRTVDDARPQELLVLVPLVVALFLLGLFPGPALDAINPSVSPTVAEVAR